MQWKNSRTTHTNSQSATTRLRGGLLEVGDEVVPVLVLLQAAEGHLGAGDVLLGVLEVGELHITVSNMLVVG